MTNREKREGCRDWGRLPAKVRLKMNGKVESQHAQVEGGAFQVEAPASAKALWQKV